MNKINLLEKKVGENSVEETKGDNYGVTESYSRGGIKNLVLAGVASIPLLFYGCGGLRFHPENVNPAEMGLRTMAITGKAGTSRLSNRQRHAAGNAADLISNRNDGENGQDSGNYPLERRINANTIQSDGNPLIYTAKEGNKNIEKKTFKLGEEIRIIANLSDILPDGTMIATNNVHLPSRKEKFTIRSNKVKGGKWMGVIYNSQDFKNTGEGAYKNIWYFKDNKGNWQEIGSVRYSLEK